MSSIELACRGRKGRKGGALDLDSIDVLTDRVYVIAFPFLLSCLCLQEKPGKASCMNSLDRDHSLDRDQVRGRVDVAIKVPPLHLRQHLRLDLRLRLRLRA